MCPWGQHPSTCSGHPHGDTHSAPSPLTPVVTFTYVVNLPYQRPQGEAPLRTQSARSALTLLLSDPQQDLRLKSLPRSPGWPCRRPEAPKGAGQQERREPSIIHAVPTCPWPLPEGARLGETSEGSDAPPGGPPDGPPCPDSKKKLWFGAPGSGAVAGGNSWMGGLISVQPEGGKGPWGARGQGSEVRSRGCEWPPGHAAGWRSRCGRTQLVEKVDSLPISGQVSL